MIFQDQTVCSVSSHPSRFSVRGDLKLGKLFGLGNLWLLCYDIYLCHGTVTEKVLAKHRSLKMVDTSPGKCRLFGDCEDLVHDRQYFWVGIGTDLSLK